MLIIKERQVTYHDVMLQRGIDFTADHLEYDRLGRIVIKEERLAFLAHIHKMKECVSCKHLESMNEITVKATFIKDETMKYL